ncbi:unnamed protein product, partial [marine sediment metagenome]
PQQRYACVGGACVPSSDPSAPYTDPTCKNECSDPAKCYACIFNSCAEVPCSDPDSYPSLVECQANCPPAPAQNSIKFTIDDSIIRADPRAEHLEAVFINLNLRRTGTNDFGPFGVYTTITPEGRLGGNDPMNPNKPLDVQDGAEDGTQITDYFIDQSLFPVDENGNKYFWIDNTSLEAADAQTPKLDSVRVFFTTTPKQTWDDANAAFPASPWAVTNGAVGPIPGAWQTSAIPPVGNPITNVLFYDFVEF